ncbi:DUF2254 domain-containing protein [Candidatus Bathyarchaeota archaeon]|nr:DUF2254 domain-containing protein [Candidatus Bathyarchaeota archaeon]
MKKEKARFSLLGLGVRVEENFKTHYFWLLASFYAVCLLWSSRLLASVRPNLDMYTLRLAPDISGIQPILSITGEILATILAISFSISIVVVQHAASSYTASILDMYRRDYLTLIFFFYYVGSLVLTIIALQFSTDLYLVNMTLVTFLFSFLFLLVQFFHIIDLIDPRNIIEKAKKQCIKDVKSIPSKVQAIIRSKKRANTPERLLIETPLYWQFVFHNETTLQNPIKKQVLLINDVITKAVSRREIETSIRGFEALSKIIESYVAIRQEDTTSDDEFLQYAYNQLLSVFNMGLDNKDAALMQEIMNTFKKIGCSTTNIKSLAHSGPNLTTNLVMTHIRNLGRMAIERDFFDASVSAIASLKTVGITAIQKTRGEGLASHYVLEIGKSGVQKRDWYVSSNALSALRELLCEAVSARIDIHSEPTVILEHIEELSILSIQKGLDKNTLQLSLFPMFPEFSIQKVVWIALRLKNEEYPEIETYPREQYSKNVLSRLIQTIGGIAIFSSKQHSPLTLGWVVDCLTDITLLMIKEKFKALKEGYKTEVLRVVTILKTAYLEIAGYSFDNEWFLPIPGEISDAITSIAVFALESQKEVTIECLDALHEMCLGMIKRDKLGYDVARCAARMGTIGAFALSKNESIVVDKAVEMLTDFDKNYLQDSPSPQKGEYIGEIKRLYEHFNTEYVMMEETEAFGSLYKTIEPTNIDSFIKLYEQKQQHTPRASRRARKRILG